MKEDIAVIGMGCRFPKAKNLNEYEQLLIDGVNAVSIPPDYRGFQNNSSLICHGGYVEDYDRFDAKLFNISPREAKVMDPQQRIMLEIVWQALEDAGMEPKSLSQKDIGIFTGVMGGEWARFSFFDKQKMDIHSGTGNGYSMVSNRISYVYDFKGPSMAIDTACSSSLVAIHTASNSLQNNECEIAIAGGVNVILSDVLHVFYHKAGLLSKEGKCKPFGSNADGLVRGEGAGVVVLKKLQSAISDQDRIYAVIKGSAVNQDGRTNGITAPNKWSQIAVIKKALHQANISADKIHYIEAHGTGTLLGDPIEAGALIEVIGSAKTLDNPCLIGSVKGNIGHLEGAAGIAGFIKAALSVYKNKVFPSINYGIGNEYIKFEQSKLRVVTELVQWPDRQLDRVVGISSFGLGGTNAHIIISNYENIKENNTTKIIPHDFSGEKYWIPADKNNKNEESINKFRDEIIDLVSQACEISKKHIDLDSSFINDLGFDSLMIVDLKSRILKNIKLSKVVSLEEFISIGTVGELIEFLNKNKNRNKEYLI